MRKIKNNNYGSAVPMILYIVTIVACGALYTLFFLEIAYSMLRDFVPESDSKVFIMMCMYAIPLLVMVIGVIAVIQSGIKQGGGSVIVR